MQWQGNTASLCVHGFCLKEAKWSRLSSYFTLGGLSNDDVDGNKNNEKAIPLDWRNNNFPRASRLFIHFFAVPACLQSESA